ncbi:endolytic transglycosylase MltG [Robiginitalea marina]|uniref:Endolytic murein transglycosylase n=1 Tax=Robiginitalea marina TaxID=2954105 RepID=A0ABT1AUM9_9FLAO|nr:endolytic transglycosylase MltG [Robiginitalea marina]MCO5723754.1 endolytic transglycosylase MltG [Robiginitalea marina]
MYLKRILLFVVFLGLLLGGLFAAMVYRTFFSPNTAFSNEVAYIYLPSDADFAQVMEQVGPLLKDPDAFAAVARRKQYATRIKGGRYPIEKGMNNNEIVNSLRSRNTPVKVSFNNQETPSLLAGRIASQLEADSASLYQAITDPEFLRANGWSQDQALLPYIPNSYEFYWNTPSLEFRERMLKEYQRFWSGERLEKAQSQGLSPEEVIALASIVHKETARVEERPRVAGVYLNRLRGGMLLQADPTVIFALKKSTGNWDTVIRRVLYRDLEIDSPFNTYKYAGIPPGPIAMPDISAIDAVLNPEKHQYLYFVADTSRPGFHLFAQTLAQHNRNREQYVRWINAQDIRR